MITPVRLALAANIRAARARAGVSQQVLAERMRALGYSQWLHQTVGATERAERRVLAEEVLGLCEALNTSTAALMNVVAGRESPSAAEILSWPPTIDPPTAGRAIGISSTQSYRLCRQGNFPVTVIRAGSRYRVVTAELVKLLGLGAEGGRS